MKKYNTKKNKNKNKNKIKKIYKITKARGQGQSSGFEDLDIQTAATSKERETQYNNYRDNFWTYIKNNFDELIKKNKTDLIQELYNNLDLHMRIHYIDMSNFESYIKNYSHPLNYSLNKSVLSNEEEDYVAIQEEIHVIEGLRILDDYILDTRLKKLIFYILLNFNSKDFKKILFNFNLPGPKTKNYVKYITLLEVVHQKNIENETIIDREFLSNIRNIIQGVIKYNKELQAEGKIKKTKKKNFKKKYTKMKNIKKN